MNFATSQPSQHTAAVAAASSLNSTSFLPATNFPHSSSLPTTNTFITAQNCFNNLRPTQQVTTSSTVKSKLMRDSVPEEVATLITTKLKTIEESTENNNVSVTTTSSLSLSSLSATYYCSTQRQTSDLTLAIAAADTTTSSNTTEEEQNNTKNNSIENLNTSNQLVNNSETKEIETSTETAITTTNLNNTTASPSDSPCPSNNSSTNLKGKLPKTASFSRITNSSGGRGDEDTVSKSSDTSTELIRATPPLLDSSSTFEKARSGTRLTERAKKKSWYNVLYPNYKSRSQDFKKLFKEVPTDERLIVDYSCALQRDILVQGRLYVSQNYVCFHANIFSWETYLSIKWKDVTSITKEKTALVIPNAILICTASEKYFFATFTTREKAFLMLFRVWQNTLMNKELLPQEMWQLVHNCYGEELGLTTDDEDYIDPTTVPTESECDLDFVSALDDSSITQRASDYNTATSNSNQSINQIITNSNRNSGSTSSSSIGSTGKLYFLNSTLKSHPSSSTTASASGSDNKTSDNNCSGTDFKSNNKTEMKPNAKELTLISAKPEEVSAGGVVSATNSNLNASKEGTKEAKNPSNSLAYDGKRKVSKNSRQRDESLCKNQETLPTDMSDSSDSDENKIPFVTTAECTSLHEGRQMVHTILPINIDTLFNLLFTKSKLLVDFHTMRKTTDTNFGDWVTNEEGQQSRIVNVTVQLAASVGPKTSKVTEYQVMRECSKPGELYSIDVNSVNAGIPYADSFSVLLHYCLVRTVDDHTMLSLHAQIKYKKSIWGVVKGFIEKNTWAGLEDFYTSLLHAIQSETCIPPAKGKGRRPRRGKHKPSPPTSASANNASFNIASTSTATCTTSNNNTTNTSTPISTATDNDSLHHDHDHDHDHHHHHYHKHHLKLNFEQSEGTAAQVRPIEDAPPAQTKIETVDAGVLAPHTLTPHKGPAISKAKPGETNTKYRWLSVFVIVLLSFLIVLNVILLLKLWKLEERIEDDLTHRARMPNLSSLKQLPNTHEDWMELLRQQELLHETELRKWHNVLQTAIELLKKTEKTLAALMFR